MLTPLQMKPKLFESRRNFFYFFFFFLIPGRTRLKFTCVLQRYVAYTVPAIQWCNQVWQSLEDGAGKRYSERGAPGGLLSEVKFASFHFQSRDVALRLWHISLAMLLIKVHNRMFSFGVLYFQHNTLIKIHFDVRTTKAIIGVTKAPITHYLKKTSQSVCFPFHR